VRRLLALAAAGLAAAAGAAGPAGELRPWKDGPAPALELQDLQARTHRLADYRGKVVLVNFWATWCEPCRDEMPSIERLRQSLKGKPFEVLAVNVGEPAARIENFRDKLPMSFTLLLDRDTKTAKAWKARILPASFLVGRDGRVRYVYYGEIDWSAAAARAKVDELLQ
jgi:peroxiredoxin